MKILFLRRNYYHREKETPFPTNCAFRKTYTIGILDCKMYPTRTVTRKSISTLVETFAENYNLRDIRRIFNSYSSVSNNFSLFFTFSFVSFQSSWLHLFSIITRKRRYRISMNKSWLKHIRTYVTCVHMLTPRSHRLNSPFETEIQFCL